jgi:hypothetical protein
MSKLAVFVSATIVLIFTGARALGAPVPEVPDAPKSEETWGSEKQSDENMALTPAPKAPLTPPARSDLRYYTARQALTVRGGFDMDLSNSDDGSETVFGVQYLLPRFLSPRLEVGADLQSNADGHIHAGYRKVFSERSYFRPSLKIGADVLLDSRDQLASFGDINNYYARTSGTLEYVVWNPYSVRLEEELLFGLKHIHTITTLGLTYGF